MSTASSTTQKTETPVGLNPNVLSRILGEGYGAGAWHGPDMKAALDDVTPEMAFWRPAPGRHSIAEIALHHAYCIRTVRGKISGREPEPFVLEGDDWFALAGKPGITWARVRAVVNDEQGRLAAAVSDVAAGKLSSPVAEAERFDLALGITCHAVYHAGQVQLIRKLEGAPAVS